jgi:hypothetical protein
LHTFADSFAACIAAIPSRSAEEPTASDVPPTARAAVEPPPLDPIDLNELKLMIQHLDTDHDLQHVGRLIARHQPQYSGCSGVVDFDLRVCSPKTLHIVHEFLRQRTAAAEGARPILPMISSSQKPPLILPVAPLLRMRTAPPPLAVQFGPVDVKPNVATEKKAIEDAT